MRSSLALRFPEPVDVLVDRRVDSVRELAVVSRCLNRYTADNHYDDQMRRVLQSDVSQLRMRIGFLDGLLLGIF